MKSLKYLTLCLGLSALLIGCSGHDSTPAPTDPALSKSNQSMNDTKACQVTPDAGPCKAQIEKFYFNPTTKKCTSFNYGGCQGTVPFETMQSCQSVCETQTSAAIGCAVNGVDYNIGDSWTQACNTCTCTSTDNGPQAICTDTPCDQTTTPNDMQQSPGPTDAAPQAAPATPANPNAQGT